MDRDFDDAKALLLEDYRYRAQALQDSEKLGENRLNLFVGFSGAVLTAVGIGVNNRGVAGQPLIQLVLASLLSGLLVIGALSFLRLIARDDHTDLCKRDLDEIRQRFKDQAIVNDLLFGYYAVGVSGFGGRKFGGLQDFMMVVNGLLLTALVGVILLLPWTIAVQTELQRIIIALAAGVVGYRTQAWYAERRHALSRAAHFARRPTHAGGVVFRTTANGPKILLTVGKSTADADVWALPKGHIERGEGHAEAAAREVREETSVVAAPRRVLDVVEYDIRGQRIRAKYYLMEYLYDSNDTGPALEHRKIQWLRFDQAQAVLQHPETRYLVRLAEREHARLNPAIEGA
jgi:ADP-ribose pyrophosphatase YjhB (NUDIX family)